MTVLLFITLILGEPKTIILGQGAATLEEAILLAKDGDSIELPKGVWKGPVTVTKSITLQGEGEIQGTGFGKVLILDAPDITVEGITVSRSGTDLTGPDSGIYLTPKATNSTIKSCTIVACCFGIWVHETRGVSIVSNRIIGTSKGNTSIRGNGIHLFDGTDLTISKNRITGGRDGIYISVTEHSLIQDNDIQKTRFGVHYMYSDHNQIIGNNCSKNKIGFALMQSKHIKALNNIASKNLRDGLLFRDAQFCVIMNNQLIGNGEGMFFFSSTDNDIRKNRILHNGVGIKIWAGSLRNRVEKNVFRGNRQQVFYVASEDMEWGSGKIGNYWGDYTGWDQNEDGLGDRPHRINSFSNNLIYKYPAAKLLLRSPALELLSLMESKLPVFKTPTIIDHKPMMKEPE